MNRDALGPVLIAVLAVVALGVGAATLDQIDSGGDPGTGPGSGGAVDFGQPAPEGGLDGPSIPPIVIRVLAVLFIAILLAGLYAWRDDLRDFAVVLVFIAIAIVLLYLLYNAIGPGGQLGKGGIRGDQNFEMPSGGGGGAVGEGVQTVTTDPLALAALVGIVLLAGVVVLLAFARRSDRIGSETADAPDPDDSTADATAVGRAAGRAADRIDEKGEARNEVYRAWEEMTDHLDLSNPRSSTPGEFARAATDAGMTRRDVDELTDLFRTVRYGGRRVTDDRESRAVTALRRIEREYAEDR